MLVILEINLNKCIFGFHTYEIKKYHEKQNNLIDCYIKDLPDPTPTVLQFWVMLILYYEYVCIIEKCTIILILNCK